MELSGPVGLRRKVETPPASFKWSSEPGTSGAQEGCYPKATSRDDQYDSSRARKDGRLLLMSTARHSAACQRIPTRTEESQKEFSPVLSFSEKDKVGTTQPHDDALLITLKIGGYDVKRVMVDRGSAAEIMYPDLFKGLKLKSEDLLPYSSLLMSFDGKLATPKGMIRLPIQIGLKIVEVNFIVVDTYSSYTAIVGRP